MKRGDRKQITVGDSVLLAEYLGRGKYCTAFRYNDDVYCFVDEDDSMKEAIALWANEIPHVPEIAHIGSQRFGRRFVNVFRMKYYRDLKASDKEAWGHYKILEKIREDVFRGRYTYQGDRPLWLWGQYFMDDIVEAARDKVPESVVEALEEIARAGSNYGAGVAFEFGKRNLGVDSEDRIVFRDILFDAEKLERELQKQVNQRRMRCQ